MPDEFDTFRYQFDVATKDKENGDALVPYCAYTTAHTTGSCERVLFVLDGMGTSSSLQRRPLAHNLQRAFQRHGGWCIRAFSYQDNPQYAPYDTVTKTPNQLVDLLEAQLAAIPGKKLLVGHSLGGLIAAEACARWVAGADGYLDQIIGIGLVAAPLAFAAKVGGSVNEIAGFAQALRMADGRITWDLPTFVGMCRFGTDKMLPTDAFSAWRQSKSLDVELFDIGHVPLPHMAIAHKTSEPLLTWAVGLAAP